MPWGNREKEQWLSEQNIQRSYQEEVLGPIEELRQSFEIKQYGALSIDPDRYPLFSIQSSKWNPENPTVLITGGVHGYETSGVQGVLDFFKNHFNEFADSFNFIGFPCISPWGYETINRWNPKTVDPNRSFYQDSPSEECQAFLEALTAMDAKPLVHFDLHETTDTDNSIFRPALEARDGVPQELSEIPDGFYLVGDSKNPQADFQKAMIDQVRKITHIAPPDEQGRLIGEKPEQEGVVNYPVKKLFLCAGATEANYVTTTEVYPDSPKVDDQNCIDAQVAAIKGGLHYLLSK